MLKQFLKKRGLSQIIRKSHCDFPQAPTERLKIVNGAVVNRDTLDQA